MRGRDRTCIFCKYYKDSYLAIACIAMGRESVCNIGQIGWTKTGLTNIFY